MRRDLRMAGAGIPEAFQMYSFEGVDNEDQGAEVQPDRITIMGNIDWPLDIKIADYQGAAASLTLDDESFEQYPYSDDFYVNKTVLILPNESSSCTAGEVRTITHVTHDASGSTEKFNFSSGLSDVNPPLNLKGTCSSSDDYDGGTILLVDVKVYWLDATGTQSGLTAGVNGYLGQAGVFYMTDNGVHYPLAQNIENFQLQYNGDLDDDGVLDGFTNWNTNWSLDEIGRIRQIKAQILGRTANRFVGVSGKPDAAIHLYRRPVMANSPAATTDDLHRRFLLESTSNVRNHSLNLYNQGER